MSKPLTKSRFTTGVTCPTKLYFKDRKDYGNKNDQDEFLKALAEGGIQIGALAKLYYPEGIEVQAVDYDEAVAQTDELLKRDKVTIFEAALRFENLFVRADILVKNGDRIDLIEVKSSSWDFEEAFEPFNKRAGKGRVVLKADKKSQYVMDVAFQTLVARKAKPNFKFTPYLMMVDKNKISTREGLHQIFLIKKTPDGRAQIVVKNPPKDLGEPILNKVELTEIIDKLITKGEVEYATSFTDLIGHLSEVMANSTRVDTPVGTQCKHCEFRIDHAKYPKGTKSGFEECWISQKKLKLEDFEKELTFDVWYFNAEKALADDKIFASELGPNYITVKENDEPGLTRPERQLLQVEFAQGRTDKFDFNVEGLRKAIGKPQYPLHFIDFETAMPAIPFHKGRRPYEQLAFQFSHHIVHEDGTFEHKSQFLESRPGVFPNFDFVRELKKALGEKGDIFRFALHENTVLNQIRAQLKASKEKDREELVAWIESVATPRKEEREAWAPKRRFIDMLDLTIGYVMLPATRGSNSIKKVLPAVLQVAPEKVLEKFNEWIVRDNRGRVMDPYKHLPPIFSDYSAEEIEKVETFLLERDDLSDGGAATIAWSRMQFTEMSDVERKALSDALLRYCKLDTLAMVMIWMWWQSEIKKAGERAA